MKEAIVFTFGRFNPPTTGHEKLIQKVAAVAKSNKADFMVFPSHSQNPKKDPLPHKVKVSFMKKMFPKYSRNIISNKTAVTAINIAVMLYNMGYKKCTMVVGGDRVTEFETLLNKYNNVEGRHGFYNFEDGINIVSAGERDPDAEGVTGMSASKMRAAAAANDYDSFKNGLPSRFERTYGQKLFQALKQGMNLSEELLEFMESVNNELSEFLQSDYMEYVDDTDDSELFNEVYEKFFTERRTAQDKDIEDRKGTQPKKYYAKDAEGDEMSKSTKTARARHFAKYGKKSDDKDSSYKPAPGDKGAKTKLSKHTKKYRQMFGEKVSRTNLFKLYNKAMKLPAGSPAHDKITKEIANMRKQLTKDNIDITPPSTALGRKFKLVKSEETNLDELVSRSQLNDLEKFADRMLAKLDIDVSFTKHFLDRLNDKRNDPEIKVSELQRFFKKILNKKGSQIKSNPNIQAVLKDVTANLNLPVVINYNNGKFEVVHKTIMRKKNFTTSNKELKYEEADMNLDKKINEISNMRRMQLVTKIKNSGVVKKGSMSKDDKKKKEEVELDEAKISMRDKVGYYYVDPKGVVQAVGSKDAMRKMNVKQAKDGNKGGSFSQNFKKYKVGDKIKEELDENKRAALAKKLSKASASTKKGKEKVTLKKAPWEKKEAANPAQQAAIAIAKKKSGKYDEDGKRKVSEKLGKDADAGDYVDDFRKSDAPQFKGKSDKKIQKMAIAAYLKAKEKVEADGCWDGYKRVGGKMKNGRMVPNCVPEGVEEKKLDSQERMQQAALNALEKLISSKGDKQSVGSYAATIAKSFQGMSGKDLETMYKNSMKEDIQLNEKIKGLVKKSDKSGISYGILKKVYDRGMAAWKTGHRPGTTPQQWAFARVNSFITGGGARKSDADLWAKR